MSFSRLYCERHAFFPDQQILKEGEATTDCHLSYSAQILLCVGARPVTSATYSTLVQHALSRDAWCIVTGCEDSRYVFAPSCCSQRPCCRKRALQSLCSTQEGFVLIMGCSFRRVHLSCVQAALCSVRLKREYHSWRNSACLPRARSRPPPPPRCGMNSSHKQPLQPKHCRSDLVPAASVR